MVHFDLIDKVILDKFLSIYQQFPYDDWKPSQQRVDFIKKHVMGETLIDIACGGHPVTQELSMGYKAGVDISVKAGQMARNKFNHFYLLDFEAASIDDVKELGTYDTVITSEFLEHTINPCEVVKKMIPLMKPRGRLLVTVPNGVSIAGYVDKLRNNGEYNRFKMYHRTHISLLSKKQWDQTFEDAGLKVELFDFRTSDIVEGFPKEGFLGWKSLCSLNPNNFAHQFYYVLGKRNE